MKTLVIDNHDSFTFNLVHLLAEATGEEPVVMANDAATWAEIAGQGFQAIVISPGPGRPDRAADVGLSAAVIEHATVPLLGVCLGHQGIASLAGARIEKAPVPMHGRLSRVRHTGDPLFAGLPPEFSVVRYHSLRVAEPLPPDLLPLAWCDEDGVLMALRHRSRLQWGVQFHPESILSEHGLRLIENFRDQVPPRLFGLLRPKPTPPLMTAAPGASAEWQDIGWEVDTDSAFVTLYGEAEHAFWLDSSLAEKGRARWSYMGVGTPVDLGDDPFAALSRPASPRVPPPCPFAGGVIGWLGYDLGAGQGRRDETPAAHFLRVDRFIAIDHLEQRTYAVALDDRDGTWRRETIEHLKALTVPSPPALGTLVGPLRFTLDRGRATYLADIHQCQEWIGEGETYQVCLTTGIGCDLDVDPLALYRVMRRINPAPHAAFIRYPGGAVCSASPERFLSVDRDGRVEAKPIKGTIARAADPAADRAQAEWLRSSEKDLAENLMIVDLLRNDLSRVCETGSVTVPVMAGIETFATVHQMVSTVHGRLRPDVGVIDAIRAAFPGGSMTGAPKERTLGLIDRLEGRARGIYSGALGWIGDDGAADLSIVIRTVVATRGHLRLGSGGAITALSDPEAEFAEMLLKAEAQVRAIVIAATGGFAPDRYHVEGA